MAGAGREVSLRFTANVTSLRAGMMTAAASVKQFEGQVLQVAKTSHETTRIAGMAMLGMGAAVAAGLGVAAGAAISFEEKMRNVSTISGDVEKNFGAAGDAILAMSGDLGIGANELAEGLYDVASSGFQGAAGMHIVEVAGIAAQAGLSSTAVAARAVTGAINAYGLAASDATDVSDIFFQTVNLGIVTFEELAQNVGDFMGTANALGIALDEASAGFATITVAGIPAAEAATSLNGIMTQLLSPSDALTGSLAALGYESAQAAVDALGLGGMLQMLRDATGSNTSAFAALFPEVRALKGALAITSNEGATWARVAGDITDKNKRAGAAAEALEKQQKSLGMQLKMAKEQVMSLAIGMGQSLLPTLRPVVDQVRNVAAGFDALGDGSKQAATWTGVVGSGVLTVGGAFLILGPKIATAVKWFRELMITAPMLAKSLRAVTLSMGALGIVLTGAAIALAVYGNKKRETKERTDEFVQALKDEKEGITETIEALIEKTILEGDLGKAAASAGLSIETVSRALNGEKDAIDEVNAAVKRQLALSRERGAYEGKIAEVEGLHRLKDAIGSTTQARADAIVEVERQVEAERGAAAATGTLTDATEDLGVATVEASDAQKSLLADLTKMVDLSAIYVDGQQAMEDAEKDANKASADRIRDGARAQVDAMDKRHKAERDALAATKVSGEAGQEAHDRAMTAMDARQDKERESADVTVESEEKRAQAIEDAATKSTLSMGAYLKMVEEQSGARVGRTRNLAAIAARGGSEEAIAELAELGDAGATVIAEIATSSEAGFADFVRITAAGSAEAAAATKAEFDLLPEAIGVIGKSAGTAFATNLLGAANLPALVERVRLGLLPVADVVALAMTMGPEVGMPTGARSSPLLPGGLGPLRGMAAGGISRHPQISSSAILWAEAGPEAYIPLGTQYRTSAQSLTAEVARTLGMAVTPMAAGGFGGRSWAVGGGFGGGGSTAAAVAELRQAVSALKSARPSQHIEFPMTFHEKIDPLHVAQKIAWRVRP